MSATAEKVRTATAADPVVQLSQALRRKYAARITGELVLPAREGTYRELPESLDPKIGLALRRRGIERLYSHQRDAW
jgi:DEAD/DEAH box helicase domain-containing protein